ncbi:MAG: complex I subunit 1 family protein [Rectinemataceae bacterium]|jgi:formate hydrogenlyase subunit 4
MTIRFMAILAGLANVLLALVLSPFFEGAVRKITAIVQSRRGPPITQAYMDLAKLLIKEDIEVGEAPYLQRFAALLSVTSITAVALFIPLGGVAPLAGVADGILIIYLLMLAGVSILLGGLAAGSTYSLIGMSREMMSMMTLEPLLAIAVIQAAYRAGSFRLDAVFGGAVYAGAHGPWSGIVLMGVMLFGLQAFVGRLPFDITEAETEIMEGPLIEYSGPKLALFKYARMIKLFVYSGLFVALFVPRIPRSPGWLSALIFLVEQSVLVLLSTVLAATHARYRIDQAIRYYIALFFVGLAALVLSLFGL